MTSQHGMRLGRWEDVLVGETCDALIFDAPYSNTTHSGAQATPHGDERNDGYDSAGLAPEYQSLSGDDVRAFCEAWRDRTRGWWVSLTDSVLAPVWRAEMDRVGRYAFAPVVCLIRGMTVRVAGDGPSSWAIYACVSRPRNREFATWGTLDGGYAGPAQPGAGGGRGKPRWLMNAIVRDYTRPGDIVIDPFAGWGSTLAACAELGRIGIGAECDVDAYAEACRRLGRPQQIGMAL